VHILNDGPSNKHWRSRFDEKVRGVIDVEKVAVQVCVSQYVRGVPMIEERKKVALSKRSQGMPVKEDVGWKGNSVT
jgi:hypothetical protein